MAHENLENQLIDVTEQRTKQETADVIEAMLNEVGMSKEELVNLLVNGINIDKHVEIEVGAEILIHIQGLSEADIEQLGAQGADVEALKAAVGAGRDKFKVFEFFNFAKILEILSKTSVIFNLEILKRLGLDISPFELEKLFNIEKVKELDTKNLRIQLMTGARQLTSTEVDKLKNYSQDKISAANQASGQNVSNSSQKRSFITDQVQQQSQANQSPQDQQQEGVKSAAQAMQQQRAMSKGLRWLRDKTKEVQDRVKNTLSKVEKRVDGISAGIAIAQAEQLNKIMSEFAHKVKDTYKEIHSVQFKGREVHVTMHGGEQQNLRDFLRDRGHYSPEMAKLVDEAGSANSELLKVLGNLQKKMTQGSEITFGQDRQLQVQMGTEKEQTKLHVLDYLHDLKNLLSGKESRLDVKTALLGDGEKSAKGKSAQGAEVEGGPKDKKSDDSSGNQAQEKEFAMPFTMSINKKAAVAQEVDIVKDVDDLRKDLIRIDAMNDAKKHLQELNEAKSLFSKGMSAMGEAKGNNTSEVMKEMKEKMQTGKQIS